MSVWSEDLEMFLEKRAMKGSWRADINQEAVKR